MKSKLNPPYLSTAFSESGKSARGRLERVLGFGAVRPGAAFIVITALCALFLGLLISCQSAGTGVDAETDSLIKEALLSESERYADAEFWAEGHIVLGAEERDGQKTIYAVTSVGGFSFMNGMFIENSGTGAIPAVVTVSGEETSVEYPMDGSYYADSIKKLFPARFRSNALHSEKFSDELNGQKRAQAGEYLKELGREADIGSYRDLNAELPDMDTEASNTVLELQKEGELWKFPMYVGNIERVENGERYIYQTLWDGDESGGTLTYTKSDESGAVLSQTVITVDGSNAALSGE